LADCSSLKLVTLNNCQGVFTGSQPYASAAARLIEMVVPAVIAMPKIFADENAVIFAHTLYQEPGGRKSIESCLVEARKAV